MLPEKWTENTSPNRPFHPGNTNARSGGDVSALKSENRHVYFLGHVLKPVLAVHHVRVVEELQVLELLELLVVAYMRVVCRQTHQVMD